MLHIDKVGEAILALASIKPPLSVAAIAQRVRTTGPHVEGMLRAAGQLAERPLLDEVRATVAMLAKDVAILQVSADLVDRGYRVYAPLNEGPAVGRKVDLLAMDARQQMVLQIALSVGGIDEAGRLQRTNPRRAQGVVVAVAMVDGIFYDPELPAAVGQ